MVRRVIGQVLADHGGVCVIDQLYAQISEQDDERIMAADVGVKLDCEHDTELDHIGVWVHTGLGDGRYPVYADVVDIPGAGERVARIVIDCLGVEDESGELRERLSEAVGNTREKTGWDVRLPYDDREVLGDPA